MSSRTSVHTEENRFKNLAVGDTVEFGANGDALVIVKKEQKVYNGVLKETILHCSNGAYTRTVGHLDKAAPSLRPIRITEELVQLIAQHRSFTVLLN